jgi:hypothetical protein
VVHRLFQDENEGFLRLDEGRKRADDFIVGARFSSSRAQGWSTPLSRFTDFAPKDLAEIRG